MRVRWNTIGFCLVFVALLTLLGNESQAQFGSANTSTFGNSQGDPDGQATNALEQTGNISSEAAIDRGTGFVGGDSSDTFNLRSAPTSGANNNTSSARGMSGMGGMGGGRGGRGGMQNQNNGRNNTGRMALRIPFRIGFQVPAVAAPVLKRTVERRITKLPGLKTGNSIVIAIEKETAILKGTVVDSDQSELIAGLLLLEPGVYKVRNELVVKAAGKAPQ